MSFFVCDIDRAEFAKLNPSLPLFPGKTNRWVLAFQSKADDVAVRRNVGFLFGLLDAHLSVTGVSPDVQGLRVDKWIVGPSMNLDGAAAVVQGISTEQLPKDYVYAGIRFVYTGTKTTLSPWPWASRGFFIRCPEDILSAVVAVFPPVEPTAEDRKASGTDILESVKSGITNPLAEAARTAKVASQILLWGGAAILLFHLNSTLKSVRSAVT